MANQGGRQNRPPFFMAMDGLYACNAGRLHGCRRYASKDGGGRALSGTRAESNAGAVAEPLPAMAEEPEFSGSCPITQVEVSMRVRRSQIDAAIRAMPAAAPIQMPGVASRP